MMDSLIGDIIVAIHLAYVGFVIFGLVAILPGALLKWRWVRNPWFRWIHLVMIVIVAAEALVDFECPLTTWERHLRREQWRMPLAAVRSLGLVTSPVGEGPLVAAAAFEYTGSPEIVSGSFVGRCLDAVMFPSLPEWAFTPIYLGVAALVVACFWLVPPRRRVVSG
jgi:hypothetical protein